MSCKTRKIWFVAATVILSFLAATVLADFALKVMEMKHRRSVLDYGDTMRTQGLALGGYLRENLTMEVTDGLGGKVRWTNNSMGFRSDREFSPQRPPGVLRILSLGDSFTAGYRVGQEETFSHLQEEWINKNYGKAEVLVAEIEEPSTALYYLLRFGIKMHPDVVLLGITLGNDIAQSYVGLDPKGGYILSLERGEVHIELNKHQQLGYIHGLENFKFPPEYLTNPHLSRPPGDEDRWWRRKYLWRRLFPQAKAIRSIIEQYPPNLLDISNGFGAFTNPSPPVIDEAYNRLFRVLTAFQTFCEQKGILLAIQLFPQRYQVQPEDWEKAVRQYGLRSSYFELMRPNKRIREFCEAKGILCIDPTEAMAAYAARAGINLYLPLGDMHWNREGHRTFFDRSRETLAFVVQKGFQVVKSKDSGDGK